MPTKCGATHDDGSFVAASVIVARHAPQCMTLQTGFLALQGEKRVLWKDDMLPL